MYSVNIYHYTLKEKSGDKLYTNCGYVLGTSTNSAKEKIMHKYNCEAESISLKCVPCIETEDYTTQLCPKCGSEMIKDMSHCYTSYPAQYDYICKKCGHHFVGV